MRKKRSRLARPATPLSCSPRPSRPSLHLCRAGPRQPAASSHRLSIPTTYTALLTTFLPTLSSSSPLVFVALYIPPRDLYPSPDDNSSRRGTTSRVPSCFPTVLGIAVNARAPTVRHTQSVVVEYCYTKTIVCMHLWDP
ncbi:hypothetical protein B0H16DRAFT_1722837 [Mycena metata]|uniref:Uncharacterized protein n=1 Tax=Mycena metata TaxID=1033252 RepID=A0AAD7J460_9AGAR|nr:hypothetical protein B0H16DRAFT_1722837 [Mycena metata]